MATVQIRENFISVIDHLCAEEGWRAKPYDDATGRTLPKHPGCRGHMTIGYGLNLDAGIDREIGRAIVAAVARQRDRELRAALPALYGDLDETRWNILLAMAYQLGTGGLLKFQRLLAALAAGDYAAASAAMLESRWARQTPARAARLACWMRGGAA